MKTIKKFSTGRCTNVRRNSLTGTYEVTGTPATLGSVGVARRLLLITPGGGMLCQQGLQLLYNGEEVALTTGIVKGAYCVGGLIVVTTTEGVIWLAPYEDTFAVIDPRYACPLLRLKASSLTTHTAALPAVAFSQPYDVWQAPLATTDVATLTTLLRKAWQLLDDEVAAASRYATPVMVRYGVRLRDGSYLCLSEPVTIGMETLTGQQAVWVNAVTSGSAVTALQAGSLSRNSFSLEITPEQGVAAAWLPLIASVDILVAAPTTLLRAGSSLNYRCLAVDTSGARRPSLEMSLPLRSAQAVQSQMEQVGWTLVATTTHIAQLAQGQWVDDPDERIGTTVLTAAEATAVTRRPAVIECTASAAGTGRLYCVTATGTLTVGLPGNPLVNVPQRVVSGAAVLAMALMPRAIHSNAFGRYPLVLFTTEGIYAVPQTTAASATFGEPRLLSRLVADGAVKPVEAGGDIYFASARGHLCRLRGNEVTVVRRKCHPTALAWDAEHSELYCLMADGRLWALLPGDEPSLRTVSAASLYDDATRAVAVTPAGDVLDLTTEDAAAAMTVEWISRPMSCCCAHHVVWLAHGDGLQLSFEVLGERGLSCHGFLVGRLRVNGNVHAPLRQRLVSQPTRTVRLRIAGTAPTGTLLAPLTLRTS